MVSGKNCLSFERMPLECETFVSIDLIWFKISIHHQRQYQYFAFETFLMEPVRLFKYGN